MDIQGHLAVNALSSGCYLRSSHVSQIHVSIDLSQRPSLHRIATSLVWGNPLIWFLHTCYPRNLRESVAEEIALFYNVVYSVSAFQYACARLVGQPRKSYQKGSYIDLGIGHN